MDKHIDISKCLTAFAVILENGKKTAQGYQYAGLWAEPLDDGYTVRIFDNQSELTIFFHNKHKLESPNGTTMDQFVNKIYQIAS